CRGARKFKVRPDASGIGKSNAAILSRSERATYCTALKRNATRHTRNETMAMNWRETVELETALVRNTPTAGSRMPDEPTWQWAEDLLTLRWRLLACRAGKCPR